MGKLYHSDSDKIDKLQKLLEEYKSIALPKGYPSACEDIDVAIFEFDGLLIGLVETFLSKREQEVDQRFLPTLSEIENKMNNCYEKLTEFQRQWQLQKELAYLLVDCIKDSS